MCQNDTTDLLSDDVDYMIGDIKGEDKTKSNKKDHNKSEERYIEAVFGLPLFFCSV